PIEVVARRLREPVIRLASLDQGRSVTLASTHEACEYSNPKDWAGLAKAALALSGITPRNPSEKLERRLKDFGGGLELTMRSSVPKGSGLGTSSILGAAILACLDRVIGSKSSVQDTDDVSALIERTSRLEQMLTTGGGWQDQ